MEDPIESSSLMETGYSESSFGSLPKEIVQYIFSFLPLFPDLIRISRVSNVRSLIDRMKLFSVIQSAVVVRCSLISRSMERCFTSKRSSDIFYGQSTEFILIISNGRTREVRIAYGTLCSGLLFDAIQWTLSYGHVRCIPDHQIEIRGNWKISHFRFNWIIAIFCTRVER